MMKTRAYTTILAVSSLMLFSAVGAPAQTAHQHDAQEPVPHDMSMMDMSRMDMASMMNEPHHVLAMAYMQNIGTFAKALHSQAEGSSPLDTKFARDVVDEMKRSLERMEDHRGRHKQAMSEETRSRMAAMMKDMDMNCSMLKDAISALEQDVQADPPDSRQVATDSAHVLMHLDEMLKMHHN